MRNRYKEKLSAIALPCLLTAYFFLHFLSANLSQNYDKQRLLSLFMLSLSVVTVTLLLTAILSGSAPKASLLTSSLVLAFFTYGHVFEGLSTLDFGFTRHRYLLSFYGLALSVAFFVIRSSRLPVKSLLRIFVLVSVFLMAMPGSRVLFALLKGTADTAEPWRKKAVAAPLQTELPDIYYIVLDEYPSDSILRRVFGHDNSDFTDFLKTSGFYVASQSYANYPRTFLSLASSLNMRYLDFLSENPGEDSTDHSVPHKMVIENRVAMTLRLHGYRYVLVHSGWGPSSRSPLADGVLGQDGMAELQIVFWSTTMLRAFQNFLGQGWRKNHLRNLDNFKRLTAMPSPQFVFAHFMLPHRPFVFGRSGEIVKDLELEFVDGEYAPATPEYRAMYLDQLLYTNQRIKQIVHQLVTEDTRPKIVILQSDHGSYPDVEWGLSDAFLQERMSILNAFYVEDTLRQKLYPTITPVNTFRIIFDHLFKSEKGLVEDNVYYSHPTDKPYRFVDVSARLTNS